MRAARADAEAEGGGSGALWAGAVVLPPIIVAVEVEAFIVKSRSTALESAAALQLDASPFIQSMGTLRSSPPLKLGILLETRFKFMFRHDKLSMNLEVATCQRYAVKCTVQYIG